MQRINGPNISTLRHLCYFFLVILLIIYVCYGYVKQHTKVRFEQLHLSVKNERTYNTIEVATQQTDVTKKLSFLVAGVKKCGTTALYHYLKQHKHLCLSKRKELHFFDNESHYWTVPNYGAYESKVGPCTHSNITGEATPIYIYWPNSLERIKRYNPDIKLILLFRQPVQRAWSQWKMAYTRHHENKSFSWAIREGRARVADNLEMPGYHRVYSYVERGFYGAQLQKALNLFSRDQLLLLLSEELQADPKQILQQVSDFLGVPSFWKPNKQLNPRISSKLNNRTVLNETDIRYLQSLYNNDLRLFAKLSNLNIDTWFR